MPVAGGNVLAARHSIAFGQRPTDAHLRALLEIAKLTSAGLTATATGCYSGPAEPWAVFTDADGRKSRGVLWQQPDGRHAVDACLMTLSVRVLPQLVEEVLAWRAAG